MVANRPPWCPDQTCAARGTVSHIICGGVAIDRGRLCLRFEEPCGVRTLESISAQENVELRLLLDLLYLESKS